MRAFSGNATLETLSCETIEEYNELIEWLSVQRWEEADNIKTYEEHMILTKEEKEKIVESERVFDYLLDFDAYFADFVCFYNINLLKDDLSFFEFNWMLSALFNKEESAIAKRIGYRSYTKEKNDNQKYANHMISQRKKYALSSDDAVFKQDFDKLFSDSKTLGGG